MVKKMYDGDGSLTENFTKRMTEGHLATFHKIKNTIQVN